MEKQAKQDHPAKEPTLAPPPCETPAGTSDAPPTLRGAVGPKPAERAFVVQIAPDWDPEAGSLSGRVQHLATADGGNFASVEGLVAIVRRVFGRAERQGRE